MKKTAFTIAEILLVMLILLTVTLATAKVLPEKAKLKTIPEKHGTYACTRDGDQYYSIFIEDQKDAAIPDLGSGDWKAVDNCGEDLDMPNVDYIGVTLIGGGGAGGKGGITTQNKNQINQNLIGPNITIDAAGTYEILVASGKGTESSLGKFREVNDTADTDPGNANDVGDGVSFSNTLHLNRGDRIRVQTITGALARQPKYCAQFENYPKYWNPGRDGEGIILTVTQGDTENKIELTGGSAGSYTCNKNGKGNSRFQKATGINGSIKGTKFGDNQSESTNSTTPNALGRISLLSLDNNKNKDTIHTPGCGGQGGKINIVAYPVKKGNNAKSTENNATLPAMTIGLGGIYNSDNEDGGDTTFDAAVAEGGKANAACIAVSGAGLNNGTNGGDASAVRNISSAGGTGGSNDSLTGGNGTGYGAGGGGGAAITNNQIGSGGNGTNGLIIMTW